MSHEFLTWFLAPANDRTDEYAAGYDSNSFASKEEAEDAIEGLRACGDQFVCVDWVAVQRNSELYPYARAQRAAKHIDATELADGRWIHYDDGTREWCVVPTLILASLCDFLDDTDEHVRSDAYSHWCASTCYFAATPEQIAEVQS